MGDAFQNKPGLKPWGPFISPDYKHEVVNQSDVIIASVVWGLTLINVLIALYLIYFQTKGSRSPLRSVYIWMIWVELLASFAMGIQNFLFLLKLVPPSFAYYFIILFEWCIQVQLLLQIIINRIRVIVPDRRKSKKIMVGTAVIVTIINISVYCIWMPARLQIPGPYKRINEIWDRMEKVIYLFMDAALNWYFLRIVKQNLINNGLQKYNRLLRFNERIIMVSLLMDVMIIAAMSIPNSFVYVQFHPLAYLVKLNIEMTMANLIKRIAISASKRTGNVSIVDEFASTSGNKSSTGFNSAAPQRSRRRGSAIELSSNFSNSHSKPGFQSSNTDSSRIGNFAPQGSQIKKTEEIKIVSEPISNIENRLRADGADMRSKSLDDITEGGESVSVKSEEVVRRGDSDDEARLVIETQSKSGWGRLRK